MTMADSIAVMNAGRVEQLGDCATLYEHPTSAFVANFLGQSNLLRVQIGGSPTDGLVSATTHGLPLTVAAEHLPAGATEVWLGVRPEKLHLGTQGGPNRLDGMVSDASFTGVATQYLVRMPWDQELTVTQPNDGSARARVGDNVTLSWSSRQGFILPATEAADAGTEVEGG